MVQHFTHFCYLKYHANRIEMAVIDLAHEMIWRLSDKRWFFNQSWICSITIDYISIHTSVGSKHLEYVLNFHTSWILRGLSNLLTYTHTHSVMQTKLWLTGWMCECVSIALLAIVFLFGAPFSFDHFPKNSWTNLHLISAHKPHVSDLKSIALETLLL